MSKNVPLDDVESKELREHYQQLQTRVANALNSGLLMQGSAVLQKYQRQTKDGLKDCGPYPLWTRKVRGKTVTVSLSEEQFELTSQAIATRREVDQLLKEMQQISQKIILGKPRA